MAPAHGRSSIIQAGQTTLGFLVLALLIMPLEGENGTSRGSPSKPSSKTYCVAEVYDQHIINNQRALLDDLKALGVTYLRASPGWHTVESHGPGGNRGLDEYDTFVKNATARGIKIIFVLAYTPSWANGCTKGSQKACHTRPPSDLGANGSADYNAFVRRMVERYGDRVKVWEIWNEPNAGYFWQEPGKTGAQIATSYTNLAKSAYTTIKAVDPTATVLVGSVSGANSSGSKLAPLDFLKVMYANGIAGKFDGLAYHPYPWTYSRAMSQDPDSFWSGMSTAYSIMQSKGDGRKKIWITEYGYTTEYTNESTVQAYLNTDGADYKTKDFLATLCWFSDRDNGEGFGLSGSTFPLAHRPRWSTFQNIITTP